MRASVERCKAVMGAIANALWPGHSIVDITNEAQQDRFLPRRGSHERQTAATFEFR
jgi:hypothetical protein